MRVFRSTKCTLKFANNNKRKIIKTILQEYGRVVNLFIDQFWINPVDKRDHLKPVIDSVLPTWLNFSMRQIAAREAMDMILASKRLNRVCTTKPKHFCKNMNLSALCANLQDSKNTTYDAWLHLKNIGNHIRIDIPIKFHKHFNRLAATGQFLHYFIISETKVQFTFKITTAPKKHIKVALGLDTGINALASLSDGKQLGKDVWEYLDRIKRCKRNSNGYKTAKRALHHYIDLIAKETVSGVDLLVFEDLKNITKNRKKGKRRLSKYMRCAIGSWNVSYFHKRIKEKCELMNVSWRSVSSFYTSITCPECGHIDRRNRDREMFKCTECGHNGNADIIGSLNILKKFLDGKYGAIYKASCLKEEDVSPNR